MLAALAVTMADFLTPDDGPGQSGDFRVSPNFFLILLGLGFVIGTIGHIVKSRSLQAAGILLIFAATIFLPIAYTVSR
ncbi:MAG TPA: hypothetical protein VGO83_05745 [Thermoleophilaceae bacterium]|nr:hypothetical protein [Thermoleophilaceae bacterium]